MPTAPNSLAKPEGPDMSQAATLQALSRSFSGLSQSIGQLGQANERKGQMLEDFGEETAAMVDFMKKEGTQYSKAFSEKQIEALDHPRAMIGAARGTAKIRAREMGQLFGEEISAIQNSDRWADVDAYSEAFSKLMPTYLQDYKGSRSDVFSLEFHKEAASIFNKYQAHNKKWINNELVTREKNDIEFSVDDIVEEMSIQEPNTIVKSTLYDPNSLVPSERIYAAMGLSKTERIIGEDPQDYVNRVESTMQGRFAAYLDGKQGDLMSLGEVMTIAGGRLVKIAAGNSELSGVAQSLLETPVGPKDSRMPLKDHPAVKKMYIDNEDRIKAQSGNLTGLSPNDRHDMNKQSVNDFAHASAMNYMQRPGDGYKLTSIMESVERDVISTFNSPEFIENRGRYIQVDSNDPDVLVFRSQDENVSLSDNEIRINIKNKSEAARRQSFDHFVEFSMSQGQDEITAIALTANQLNFLPEKHISKFQESLTSLSQTADQYTRALSEDPNAAPPRYEDFKEQYELYRMMKDQNPQLTNELFKGNKPTRVIMEAMEYATSESGPNLQPFDAYSRILSRIPSFANERYIEGFHEEFDRKASNLGLNPSQRMDLRRRYIGNAMVFGADHDNAFNAAMESMKLHSHDIGGNTVVLPVMETTVPIDDLQRMFGGGDPNRGFASKWLRDGAPGMDDIWYKTNREALDNIKDGTNYSWDYAGGDTWILSVQNSENGFPLALHTFTYSQLIGLTQDYIVGPPQILEGGMSSMGRPMELGSGVSSESLNHPYMREKEDEDLNKMLIDLFNRKQ